MYMYMYHTSTLTHTHTSYMYMYMCPLPPSGRRLDSANTEPLRDSVDLSDLLENSEEREEDRKKK